MIPLIRWELKQRKYFIFWWCICLILLIALLLLIYPSIRDQAKTLNDAIMQLPENLRSLRGVNGDFTSPVGYLNSQLYYITLPLILSILTIGLGSSLLGREEQTRTIEMLLARPISRRTLIMAKAISGIVMVIIISFITTLALMVLIKVVNMDISVKYVLLTSAYCTLLAIAFGSISFMLTAVGGASRRASIAVASFVAFGGYILSSLSQSSDWIKTPANLLPFHYYTPDQLLIGKVSLGLSVYLASIIVISAVLSVIGFQRRDIG